MYPVADVVNVAGRQIDSGSTPPMAFWRFEATSSEREGSTYAVKAVERTAKGGEKLSPFPYHLGTIAF